eukprot:PhF_6_TR12936/c1_g1_i1/m.20414
MNYHSELLRTRNQFLANLIAPPPVHQKVETAVVPRATNFQLPEGPSFFDDDPELKRDLAEYEARVHGKSVTRPPKTAAQQQSTSASAQPPSSSRVTPSLAQDGSNTVRPPKLDTNPVVPETLTHLIREMVGATGPSVYRNIRTPAGPSATPVTQAGTKYDPALIPVQRYDKPKSSSHGTVDADDPDEVSPRLPERRRRRKKSNSNNSTPRRSRTPSTSVSLMYGSPHPLAALAPAYGTSKQQQQQQQHPLVIPHVQSSPVEHVTPLEHVLGSSRSFSLPRSPPRATHASPPRSGPLTSVQEYVPYSSLSPPPQTLLERPPIPPEQEENIRMWESQRAARELMLIQLEKAKTRYALVNERETNPDTVINDPTPIPASPATPLRHRVTTTSTTRTFPPPPQRTAAVPQRHPTESPIGSPSHADNLESNFSSMGMRHSAEVQTTPRSSLDRVTSTGDHPVGIPRPTHNNSSSSIAIETQTSPPGSSTIMNDFAPFVPGGVSYFEQREKTPRDVTFNRDALLHAVQASQSNVQHSLGNTRALYEKLCPENIIAAGPPSHQQLMSNTPAAVPAQHNQQQQNPNTVLPVPQPPLGGYGSISDPDPQWVPYERFESSNDTPGRWMDEMGYTNTNAPATNPTLTPPAIIPKFNQNVTVIHRPAVNERDDTIEFVVPSYLSNGGGGGGITPISPSLKQGTRPQQSGPKPTNAARVKWGNVTYS